MFRDVTPAYLRLLETLVLLHNRPQISAMQLASDSNSVHNAVFQTRDSSLAYLVESLGWTQTSTHISRLNGKEKVEFATIKLHSFSQDEVHVHGKSLKPYRAGSFTRYICFIPNTRKTKKTLISWKCTQ
jgi:hypothetical protein